MMNVTYIREYSRDELAPGDGQRQVDDDGTTATAMPRSEEYKI